MVFIQKKDVKKKALFTLTHQVQVAMPSQYLINLKTMFCSLKISFPNPTVHPMN